MADRMERVTVTSKRQITLPAEFCRHMGIKQGDQLEILAEDGELKLRALPRFAPLTKESSLFKVLGAHRGPGGSGARDHDAVLAEEADHRTPRA